MTATDRKSHWENIYSTRREDEVSWFQENPALSVALIREAGITPSARVIDVGGGGSRLVDVLVAEGQAEVTVLDLADAALARARQRLGEVPNVTWVVADVTDWTPDRQFDLWHDRATFHFLTTAAEQAAYVRVMNRALKPGGIAIIGTFAPDGPQTCSGLPVSRHDAASLQAILGNDFRLLATRHQEHVTPRGAAQKFQFSTFAKLT